MLSKWTERIRAKLRKEGLSRLDALRQLVPKAKEKKRLKTNAI